MKKKLVVLCLSLSILSMVEIFPSEVKGEIAEIGKENLETFDKNLEETITPYADIIETKLRIYNGVWQYRRWNKTKGCWVDEEWINL